MITKKNFFQMFRKAILLFCAVMIAGLGELAAQGKYPVNLKYENTPLKTILEQITAQTNLKFIYTDKVNVNDLKVSISCNNEPVEQVMARLLDQSNISYMIQGNQVVLSNLPTRNAVQQVSQAVKVKQLSGKVTDEVGESIPGVAIQNLATKKFVATDLDGGYQIEAKEGDVLQFTSIGMATKEIQVTAAAVLNVALKADAIALEDVVITGYQTLSKERSTGSYAVVTSQKLEKKLQPSITSILEGQSAGVVVNKDGKMEIRGVSTIQGTKDPLIVVDGYPLIGDGVGLESINPDNIENITVLKDAVAASIYGSRASNGVIVITTKSGQKGSGSGYKIGYKGTYGITLKPDLSKLNMASTADYMDAELDLYLQNPNSYKSSYESYNRLSDYTYLLMAKDQGMISVSEADAQIAKLKSGDAMKQIEDNLIRAKQSHQHNLSLSAGSDKNQFGGVLRYAGEYGHLKHNDNSRLTIDLNNTWKPVDWFTFRILSNINYSKDNSTTETWSSLTDLGYNSRMHPYSQLYDANGVATSFAPVGQRRMEAYQTTPGMKSILYHPETDLPLYGKTLERLQIRLGGDVNIKFCDFLTGSVGGSWVKGSTTNKSIADASSFIMRTAYNDGTSLKNPTKHYIPDGGKIDETRSSIMSWVIRAQLNYNQAFNDGKHRITAMFGSEISRDTYETTYLPTRLGYDPVSATYNSGFSIHDYSNNVGNMAGDMLFGKKPTYLGTLMYGGSKSSLSDYGVRDNRFVSWYGNASYEFNNRYVVTGSIRLDLTNFFGTDPKFRYKPTWSVGGVWRVSEETFFTGLKDIFNRFNIRASYGVNGNISLDNTPYLILSVGAHNNNTGGVSYGINSYPNNQLRWERTQIVDFGLDFAMLNNRLNVGFDYYHKKSTDLIASEAIDETKGTSSIPQNVGGLTNQGFEISINGDVIRKKDFIWNSSLITSYNASNVDNYNVARMYFGSFARASSILVQGYPMDGLWGGRFAGLDNKGTSLFYTADGQKVEQGSLKAEDAVYLGTSRPPLDMSWTNSFQYKNWEMSFMFIGKFGHKYRKDSFSGSNYNNRHVSERWKNPGDEATAIYPRLTSWNMDMFTYPYSDHLIASANYVKLRDLTLTYNFPKSLVNKMKLSGLKVYFQTRNLFYITASGVDIDPETAEVNTTGGTAAMTNQAYTSLSLRPEFYFGVSINL